MSREDETVVMATPAKANRRLHPLLMMIGMLFLAVALTHIVPSGRYDRVEGGVVPGSYHVVPKQNGWSALLSGTAPTNAPATKSSDVIVAGSGVVRNEYLAPTPVTVLGRETLDQMGKNNVADALNQLPQLSQSVTPTQQSASLNKGISYSELSTT